MKWKTIKIVYCTVTPTFDKLCFMEKLYFLNALVNQKYSKYQKYHSRKREIVSKYRHQGGKVLLKNVKDRTD